jgi:hypothetical protein
MGDYFRDLSTSPGPPAPTRGRAGHRWRRWPRSSVATGGRILAPTPRRHRPGWETFPEVDLRVVQPVPDSQRPPEAEPVTGGAGLCARSWLSGNLGKTALRLLEIVRMYYDTQ